MKFSEAIIKFNAWQHFGKKRENTVASYKVHLMHLALYMRNCEIEVVTLDDILGYYQGMEDVGWHENSFLVKCIAFRKFFEFYTKQGITKIDPELIPIRDREYARPKVANVEDYEKVLNAIPENNDPRHIRNRLMLMMFRDGGPRLSELLSLNLTDLHEETINNKQSYYAIIKTVKTKKLHPIRKLFWTEETNEQLQKWLKKRLYLGRLTEIDPEALFISVTGIKMGRRLNKSGATEVMRRLSHTAKLTYVLNSHSLRHLFGHEMAREKIPNSTISTMLGHATPVSSYVYTMLNEQEMGETYHDLRRKK